MELIFGYGSLINTASRLRTSTTGPAIPVRVKGWQRAWNYHNKSRSRNVLGVHPSSEAFCNGVIFPIEDCKGFDERERGYERKEIKRDDITCLNGQLPEGKVWIYVPKEPKEPSEDSPLQQTYMDVVICGCLEFSREFAEELIQTTQMWDYPWVNDRNNPGYERTLLNLPVELVDEILKEKIGRRKDVL